MFLSFTFSARITLAADELRLMLHIRLVKLLVGQFEVVYLVVCQYVVDDQRWRDLVLAQLAAFANQILFVAFRSFQDISFDSFTGICIVVMANTIFTQLILFHLNIEV